MSASRWASLDAAAASALLAEVDAGSSEVLGSLAGEPALIIELSGVDLPVRIPPSLPCVVIGIDRAGGRAPAPVGVDIAITTAARGELAPGWVGSRDPDGEVGALLGCIESSPRASVVLAQLLRVNDALGIDEALVVESLAYSTLHSSTAFVAWLARRPLASPGGKLEEPGQVVRVERDGDDLTVTLARPHVRNAVSARLRDELCDALAGACADPTIRSVHLRGEGASFSSGGDLAEFGSQLDRTEAHLIRTTRSPGRLLSALGERTVADVHGTCVGAGIELAAFAHRVVAAPDTEFLLPEVGFGLIPGAGGTVSISRRIGRHRCAWLALTGRVIDAPTASSWGLVDDIES